MVLIKRLTLELQRIPMRGRIRGSIRTEASAKGDSVASALDSLQLIVSTFRGILACAMRAAASSSSATAHAGVRVRVGVTVRVKLSLALISMP